MARGIAIFKCTALVGGTINALDGIDAQTGGPLDGGSPSPLQTGDIALVFLPDSTLRFYQCNATSGEAENLPSIIEPDYNAGPVRWELFSISYLRNGINYVGDVVVREAGKGIVFGDGLTDGSGPKIYKPQGNFPLRIVPKSDEYGVAFRNAANNADAAVVKGGFLQGLAAPTDPAHAATKGYVDSAPALQCETWQIKSSFSGSGTAGQVISGSGVWGRKTNALLVGTGVSEAAGIFTWPESAEGVWTVLWNPKVNASGGDGYTLSIEFSQDGGTNWRDLAGHQTYSPADPQTICLASEHFNVDDYSQCQMRLICDNLNSDSAIVAWESQLIFQRHGPPQ